MNTKKGSASQSDPDRDSMRSDYDFSHATRGATAKRYAEGSNVVVIDPDLQTLFPTSEAVNRALRELATIAERARSA